jgi:hypothetical protein
MSPLRAGVIESWDRKQVPADEQIGPRERYGRAKRRHGGRDEAVSERASRKASGRQMDVMAKIASPEPCGKHAN